ncbi:PadR family transcriptional regulator [Kitasatospora sp. NPDC008050]|uniref:PadR family transcriptional regulator n=1 Tax=Kitasatospora sp. NPDC008050 TaxID=3364021 RepID=UPI0036E45612
MARRKLSNVLALAVLVTVAEQPRHPYEIAQVLRSRGKDQSIKINYGSLYTVVQNLEKHGFIEEVGTERDGRRPERTVYGATAAGRAEMHDWLAELLGTREKEYPRFESALSMALALHPDEVNRLLRQRLTALDEEADANGAMLAEMREVLPRILLIEGEYNLAMARAEADWVRELLRELADGAISGAEQWRDIHETGQLPERWKELDAEAARAVERAQSEQHRERPDQG